MAQARARAWVQGTGTGGTAPVAQTGRTGSANMARAESTGRKKSGFLSFYH